MAELGGVFSQDHPKGLAGEVSPGAKVVSATLFSFTAAVLTSWSVALLALVMGVAMVPPFGVKFGKILSRLVVVNVFVLFLWPALVFFGPGPWIEYGFLSVSRPGLVLSVLITLKSNAIILALAALISTMEPHMLGYGLKQLRVPDKLTQLFMFTYRYIHVINEEYQRLKTAAKMRGFVPKTNMHTYKTYAHMVGMLLVKSWDRAIRVRQAMLLRGFTGTYHTLDDPRRTGKDYALIACFALISGVLLALNFIRG